MIKRSTFSGLEWRLLQLLRKPVTDRRQVTVKEVRGCTGSAVTSFENVLAQKPSWVKRNITDQEATALARAVTSDGAVSAIEIGVASGFSSAVMFSALAESSSEPRLYSLDWSKKCYFDTKRNTGDAFYEIHGSQPGFSLTTSVHSGMIRSMPMVDFLFIDANHANPWPALDMLSLTRFLKPGGIIALHDIEMVYHNWGRHGGGPRDIYRSYRGKKWRHEGSSNIGFLVYNKQEMIACSQAALAADWDCEVPSSQINEFRRVIVAHGLGGGKLSKYLKHRKQEEMEEKLVRAATWRKAREPEPVNN